MKKLLIATILAVVGLVTSAFAQIEPVVTKGLFSGDSRAGLSVSLAKLPVETPQIKNARFTLLVLTDMDAFEQIFNEGTFNGLQNLYVGPGVRFDLVREDRAALGLLIGYTVNVRELNRTDSGQLGVGLTFNYKF